MTRNRFFQLADKRIFFTLVHGILFIIITIVFTACSKDKAEKQLAKPAVPVVVSTAAKTAVPVQINAIGTVDAYAVIAVKARVGGELTGVYFTEGDDVKKGDLLFSIDQLPFKAALESAKANLRRDTALLKKAEEDVRRYTELLREGLISRTQYDQAVAIAEALKATTEAGKAALELAQLQLEYCSIYAPVSGRTGSLLVDKGNLVKANDDKAMVVINQIQPVYVVFSVPEQNLQEVKRNMASGKLKVSALITAEHDKPEYGVLTFVDNAVDTATGMVRLKGTFPNTERRLWPGQFVNVVMTLSVQHDAVVVPVEAVQTGQQGQYVFVVGSDKTAEMRPVESSRSFGDIAVIRSGLGPGEVVVTEGQMRLIPGAVVDVKETKDNQQGAGGVYTESGKKDDGKETNKQVK